MLLFSLLLRVLEMQVGRQLKHNPHNVVQYFDCILIVKFVLNWRAEHPGHELPHQKISDFSSVSD